MKHSNVFAIITTVLLSLGLFLPTVCFLSIASEQIQTGWGGGTNLEMGIIYVIFAFCLSVPSLIVGVTYFIFGLSMKEPKNYMITNTVLLSILILEFILSFLFIAY